jgi:hypothetical protein
VLEPSLIAARPRRWMALTILGLLALLGLSTVPRDAGASAAEVAARFACELPLGPRLDDRVERRLGIVLPAEPFETEELEQDADPRVAADTCSELDGGCGRPGAHTEQAWAPHDLRPLIRTRARGPPTV